MPSPRDIGPAVGARSVFRKRELRCNIVSTRCFSVGGVKLMPKRDTENEAHIKVNDGFDSLGEGTNSSKNAGRRGVYRFSHFEVDVTARKLLRGGQALKLGNKAFDLLVMLIQSAGETVKKEALFKHIWPDTFIDETNLRVHVLALRKALEDKDPSAPLIINVPGRGYRFGGRLLPDALLDGRNAIDEAASVGRDSNLPALVVNVIGRDEVVGRISDELKIHRLVSIVGTGGIGKTTVALAVANRVQERFRAGVHFVDLAPVDDEAIVIAHIATSLRIQTTEADPIKSLVAALKNRNLLIVLDNCDRVVPIVSTLAESLLAGAAQVHILVTSRRSLGAKGERVHRLEPLPVPEVLADITAEVALAFPAVQLLQQCMYAGSAAAAITDATARHAASLVARLDGLPLAIELAAVRVGLLGLRGVLERLDDRFSLLTRGRSTAERRHQTLAAMIDWSFADLDDTARRVWSYLGVFCGPFGFEHMQGVVGALMPGNPDLIDVLDQLIERSMVVVDFAGEEIQYRLLESMRFFACERLSEADRMAGQRAHAEFYTARAIAYPREWEENPNQEWLKVFGGELMEIRSALNWAFSPDGDARIAIKLAAASAPLWSKFVLYRESRDYLELAKGLLERYPDVGDEIEKKLFSMLGWTTFWTRGPGPVSRLYFERGLEIASRMGDVVTQLELLWVLSGTSAISADPDLSLVYNFKFEALLPYTDDPGALPLFQRMIAFSLHQKGELAQSLQYGELAWAYANKEVRASRGTILKYDHRVTTAGTVARTYWIMGRPDKAAAIIDAVIEELEGLNAPGFYANFHVATFLPLSLSNGRFDQAECALAALIEVLNGLEAPVWTIWGDAYRRIIDLMYDPSVIVTTADLDYIHGPAMWPFFSQMISTLDQRLIRPSHIEMALGGPERWFTAEILRGHAEQLLAHSKPDLAAVEGLLRRSLDIAKKQGALAWELRTATSLLRLKPHDVGARYLLQSAYDRFEEGFGNHDQVAARELLRNVSSQN